LGAKYERRNKKKRKNVKGKGSKRKDKGKI
jgi:hypothetical protein